MYGAFTHIHACYLISRVSADAIQRTFIFLRQNFYNVHSSIRILRVS